LNLLRAAATVSGLTFLSRITGLIREYLTATVFGASALTDAFFVSFRLPNLLRRLFAEGAFSQAFVPILAQTRVQQPDAAKLLVDRVGTVLFWVVLTISVVSIAFAPVLVYMMASGLAKDPQVFDIAILMTRWMFPYILFMSLVAFSAGILNTWKQFAVPAFTPVLLNLAFIFAALVLTRFFDPPIYALAAGVLLGGAAQLAIQIPALLRIGMLPRIGLGLRSALADPNTRRIIRQMGPAVLAVSVAQISLIINTHIASRLAQGSVSWVSYGDRLMEFPTAMLGVAIGTVLLPSLSRAGTNNDSAEYSTLLDWGLRLAVLLAVPCMVGLALLALPLTALLFHYGKFSAHDVQMTQFAVTGYSVGLLGLIAVKVLAPAFYAKQDIRTPVKIGLFVLAVTQLLNLLFVPLFAHAGLALSISIAALLNALLLLIGLRRRGNYQPAPGWLLFIGKILAAAALMAAVAAYANAQFDWLALQSQPWLRVGLVLAMVAVTGAVYLAALFIMGIRPRQFLRRSNEAR
jgi:putative peptidoglycan lipid II flippase